MAVAILVIHWPPGGGPRLSQLAFAQGAGLVFVVILLTLFNAPLAAGQTLGWDAGWVARDRATWSGLALVAALSVGQLWLGWSQPERPEEAASILLTVVGLSVTGMVAGRLVFLADPGNQLESRIESQLPRVTALIRKSRESSVAAAKRGGMDADLAKAAGLYADRGAQEGVRGIIRQLAATTNHAAHRGTWDLAVRAHAAMARVTSEYVRACGATRQDDLVVDQFCTSSDDLHKEAGSPQARFFSQSLVWQMREVALSVAAQQQQADVPQALGPGADSGALVRFGFTVDRMIRRRIGDDDSPDAAAGIRVIGDCAAAAIQLGDAWGALGDMERALFYAARATAARRAHLAAPAWEEGIRILLGLAIGDAQQLDPLAFSAGAEKLTNEIRKVPAFPTPLMFSGFEPVVSGNPLSDKPSVPQAAYYIWESERVEVRHLADWSRRAARVIAELANRIEKADDVGPAHVASRDAGEVIHQLNTAAAVRLRAGVAGEAAQVEVALAAQLGALRTLLIGEDGVRRGHAVQDLLHLYATGVAIAFFALQRVDHGENSPLLGEVDRLLAALSEAPPEVLPSSTARASLEIIATTLERAHQAQLASRARETVERIPSASSLEAGVIGFDPRALHRGLIVSSFIEDAEAWLGGERQEAG